MTERTATISRPECPHCKADLALPVGTSIPSLPHAIFWPCPQCGKGLLIYLDMTGATPSLCVARIAPTAPTRVQG